MKMALMFSILFIVVSCVKQKPEPDPMCKTLFKTTTATANIIATVLECKNPSAIAGDISEQIMKLGLCKEVSQQSIFSDIVCPQISSFVTTIATNTIPTTWECSTKMVNTIIKTQISDACVKMIK